MSIITLNGHMLPFPRPFRPRYGPLVLPGPSSPAHYPYAAAIAARPCAGCGRPIGYGRPFWFVATSRPEVYHRDCSALSREAPCPS